VRASLTAHRAGRVAKKTRLPDLGPNHFVFGFLAPPSQKTEKVRWVFDGCSMGESFVFSMDPSKNRWKKRTTVLQMVISE
jgi:hypothetical protein